MDEDWRKAFEILMCMEICDGPGAGYAMVRHRLALVVFAGTNWKIRYQNPVPKF